MPDISAFLLTALVIELTPGPNMAYIALISAIHGRVAGLVTTAGVAVGLLLVGMAAAFGIAALLSSSPLAFMVLRWGGAAYLVWLAWEAWSGTSEVSLSRSAGAVAYFRRGLIVNTLNPKAFIFFAVVIPSFADPVDPILGQTITLTVVYVALATAVHLLLVAMASRASNWLSDPERQKLIRRFFALLLIGLAAWFLFDTQGATAGI